MNGDSTLSGRPRRRSRRLAGGDSDKETPPSSGSAVGPEKRESFRYANEISEDVNMTRASIRRSQRLSSASIQGGPSLQDVTPNNSGGDFPVSSESGRGNPRQPPAKRARLSVDTPRFRANRTNHHSTPSKYYTDPTTSPRRSKRERRLVYGNLSQSSIEKQLLNQSQPVHLVDVEDLDEVDPYEKILSPTVRRLSKHQAARYAGGDPPVQMLTRRQRRLLGAMMEENEEVVDNNAATQNHDQLSDAKAADGEAVGQEVINENQEEEVDENEKEGDKQEEEETQTTSESEEEEEEEAAGKSYNFRKRQPVTYQDRLLVRLVPQTEQVQHRREARHGLYNHPRSPAYNQQRQFAIHRRRKTHRSSSSTTSSGEDSDEAQFKRRKSRSMLKARQRCLPMNVTGEDMAGSAFAATRDRQKVGSSLADVDPMNIDRSITFDSIGGLKDHLQALKEMVVFPLLYPGVFERFNITPPRGVLFHGAPGCGKTLVARALANECSKGERKVAFFMRKGADCLSKWVGESERQLRLLFDQAFQMRPSIIFFDEIDGLAPVRSSKQDQIHSSIVSTLLALMDGLDNRGEIVVIGATNRIDAIDPAFRRPGRFDREFFFPLPSNEDRTNILAIHTKEWRPRLKRTFLQQLAELTVGYCGADLKALCTETALAALRRTFPQIYQSSEKLVIDAKKIRMQPQDFLRAMERITPTSQRVEVSPAKSLSPALQHLLSRQLREILSTLMFIFPAAWKQVEKAAHVYAPPRSETHCASTSPNLTSSTAVGESRKEVVASERPSDSLHSKHLASSSRKKNYASLSSPVNNQGGAVPNGGHTSSEGRRNAHSLFSVETILSTPEKTNNTFTEHTDTSVLVTAYHKRDSMGEKTPSSSRVSTTTTTSLQTSFSFLGQSFSVNEEQVYFDSTVTSGTELGIARMDIYEEEEEEDGECDVEVVDASLTRREAGQSSQPLRALSLMEGADPHRLPTISRSRLLLYGQPLMGQTEHIGPALLHLLEGFTQHVLDMSALYSVAMRTPEEACHQIFREARRSSPSVVYLPNMDMWWDTASDSLKAVFKSTIESLPPSKPLLVLGTCEQKSEEVFALLTEVFDPSQGEVCPVGPPTVDERRAYFEDVVLIGPALPPIDPPRPPEVTPLEELPKAAPSPIRELSENEKKNLLRKRQTTLRELRVFLRDATNKLMAERRFKEFTKPVDPEEVPDYYQVVSHPMDLSTVMKRIDEHCYEATGEWLKDIDLITRNALEYNPEHDNESRLLRHRACELQDAAHSFMDRLLNEDFDKLCEDLKESSQRLGLPSLSARHTNPAPYHVSHGCHGDSYLDNEDDDDDELYCRRSLRQQGVEAPVEGLSYYGPRRNSRKRAMEDGESDREGEEEEEVEGEEEGDGEGEGDTGGEMEEREARSTEEEVPVDDEVGGSQNSSQDYIMEESTLTDSIDRNKKDFSLEKTPPLSPSVAGNEQTQEVSKETYNREAAPATLMVQYSKAAIYEAMVASRGQSTESNIVCNGISNHVDCGRQDDGDDTLPVGMEVGIENRISVLEVGLSSSVEESVEVVQRMREVTLDKEQQLALLERVVSLTEGKNLQVLQKVYSMLAHLVFRHRLTEDRNQLLKEMHSLMDVLFP